MNNRDERWVLELPVHSHNVDNAVCLAWQMSFYVLNKLFGMQGDQATHVSQLYYENKDLNNRAALRPSRLLLRLVALVLKQTAHMCEDPRTSEHVPCPFTTVHVRLEDDFIPLCQSHARMGRMRCLIGEDEIVAKLKQHNIRPGSLLHIASGVPISKLTTLCSQYKCFQTAPLFEKLLSEQDAPHVFEPLVGPSKCLTREVKAVVEFWTATHAGMFFGNFYSSFSVELAAEMTHLAKPHVFLNEPCEEGMECT